MKNSTYLLLAVFLISCNFHKNDNKTETDLKSEYGTLFNYVRYSGYAGFRTVDNLDIQGDLVTSYGDMAIEGKGFFKVKDCITGKYYFTRMGSVQIEPVLFDNKIFDNKIGIFSLDFKEFESRSNFVIDTNISDLEFDIWEPIGDVETNDGVYYTFNDYREGSGKIKYDMLEVPVGDISSCLSRMLAIINELRQSNSIDMQTTKDYTENIEFLKKNYINLMHGIFYERDKEKRNIFIDLIMKIGFE